MKRSGYRLALLAFALATSAVLHAEGEPDTTFSGGGRVSLLPSTGYLYESRILPDGKILVGTIATDPFRPSLARLLPDGTPDSTFGNQGTSGRSQFDMTPFGFSNSSGQRSGFTLSPDSSKIYMSGWGFRSLEHQGAILRVNSDGQLDTSFGWNGVVTFSQRNPIFLASDPDGRIAGLANAVGFGAGTGQFVFRVLADGSPDTSFGGGGFIPVAAPAGTDVLRLQRLLRATDGSYYLSGTLASANSDEWRFAILHFLADGTRDTAFAGNSGIALIDFNLGIARKTYEGELALLDDGKLMLASTAGLPVTNARHCAVARLMADGTLDATFGNGGMLHYGVADPDAPSTNASCHNIVVRRDGRFIVSGYSLYNTNPFAMALNADGSIYTNYGVNGIARVGGHCVLDHADRLVVAGRSGEMYEPFVARLTSNDAIFDDGFEP